MNLKETVLKRRSIRKFSDELISDELINELLISAMAAPSARNQQPWEFYVIKNNEVLTKIRSVAKNFDFNNTLSIVVCGNKERSITQNDNDFWIQDCAAAVENILLSATSLGLGAVWCGLFPVLERSNAIKTIINVSDNIVPMALIQMGIPAEEKEERTQYNSDYVHFID